MSIVDFEAALKKHLEFRLKEGEGRNNQVYKPIAAGDYFKYHVRCGPVTLAERDAGVNYLKSG